MAPSDRDLMFYPLSVKNVPRNYEQIIAALPYWWSRGYLPAR